MGPLKLMDDFNIWQALCESKHINPKNIFLIFNYKDIFWEKLLKGNTSFMSCFPDFKNQHNRYSSYSKILIHLPLVLIQLIGEYEGYVDFLEAIQFLQNKIFK